jgi:hypothetical protein
MNKLCRSCKHWTPLFSGEAWGVRSFADAPDDVRAKIKTKLAAQIEALVFSNPSDFGLQHTPGMAAADYSFSDDVPGGFDWPEWGECQRTELESESAKTSLARAVDGSLYRAVLRCHADFGCVQWEPVAAQHGGADPLS